MEKSHTSLPFRGGLGAIVQPFGVADYPEQAQTKEPTSVPPGAPIGPFTMPPGVPVQRATSPPGAMLTYVGDALTQSGELRNSRSRPNTGQKDPRRPGTRLLKNLAYVK